MIARIRLVPVHHMAATLGEHLPGQCPTPEAAEQLLRRLGYDPDDVKVGLDMVLALVAQAVAAAASERPWARALGVVRDLTALAAVVACVFLWALPA